VSAREHDGHVERIACDEVGGIARSDDVVRDEHDRSVLIEGGGPSRRVDGEPRERERPGERVVRRRGSGRPHDDTALVDMALLLEGRRDR
jgi:hypothetical protein